MYITYHHLYHLEINYSELFAEPFIECLSCFKKRERSSLDTHHDDPLPPEKKRRDEFF